MTSIVSVNLLLCRFLFPVARVQTCSSGNIIFTVLDYPDASLSSTQASCGDNEGTITVTFTDEQFVTSLVISLNGGASYSAPIPDNQGSATFTDLAPGMYPV